MAFVPWGAGFLLRRAAGLAAKYGARWVVRAGVGTAARRAAARAAFQIERGAGERFVGAAVTPVQRALFGGGVTATAAGGAYAAYKSIQAPVKTGKRSRDSDELAPSKRLKYKDKMAVTMGIVKRKYNIGRKEPYGKKVRKLVKASERTSILTFRGINPLNAATGSNKGWFTLVQGDQDDEWTQMPVHCYNLTAQPQGGVTDADGILPYAIAARDVHIPWRLCLKKSAGVDDNAAWLLATGGADNSGAAGVRTWQVEHISDFQQAGGITYPPVGRYGYIDWIQIRMMVYGKKLADTKLRVRLVKFTQDHYTPEYGTLKATDTLDKEQRQEFVEQSKALCHSLVNNPVAVRRQNVKGRFFNTLYEKFISIPPKSDDDSNDDPLMINLNIFKRMNKMFDYSSVFGTDTDLEDITQLNSENYINASRLGYTCQPKNLRDNIYLLITAWDPYQLGSAIPSTSYQNTYDLSIRKKITLAMDS